MLESHIFNIFTYYNSIISKQNVIHFGIGGLTNDINNSVIRILSTYNTNIIIVNKAYLHKN